MNSNLKIIPMTVNSDLEDAFLLYKESLEDVIAKTFGWNEKFQRGRFFSQYQLNWFYWVETDSQRVGYICFWQSDLEMHVSLIIILPEKQRRSYGRQIMLHLHNQARESGRQITLSSFKQNEGAIRFYETLGYRIVGSDENFVDMVFTVL
jgi:ribosomal protein S18 acetylase RimI-like enzyme